MPYLEVTQDYEKYSGKTNGLVNLNQGDIVFAEEYNPLMENTRIHSFILDAKFHVPTAILKLVQLTDKQATMLRELEAYNKKLEYLKGKPQFTTPVTARAVVAGDEANGGDEADADADAKAYAKAYAEYLFRARKNVSNWLNDNTLTGGKKKRTKRNKRVKSRRRIKGKSVRRRK